MKQNILYFFIVVGLLSFVAVSCSREEEMPVDDTYALILQTSVSSPATKAEVPSVTSLKEDAVDLLNVYFYGTFSGDASPSIKHYTLTSASDKTDETSWRVSGDWRADGFVPGNSYDVYVSANSRQVKTAANSGNSSATSDLASASITDLAGLKSMIEFDYDPSEDNGEGGHKPYWGAYNEDNLNPEWLDLHKKYIPDATFNVSTGNSQQKRYYANEKSFLMDGKTTFTAGSTESIALALVRAAAKIVVDVKFSDTFITSLAAKNVEVTGAPAWRFYNFSFSTPVIDPSKITGADVNYNKSIFVAGGIMMGNDAVDTDLVYTGADKHFTFATYTYPLSWTAGSASSEAPAIILSLGYKDTSTDVTTYQTYKIPVVNPEGGVTAIGRNKLYKIEATIASEGGELLTDAYKVRCNYDIIPWGDIPVNSEDIADVDHSDNDYFDVSPTSVALRGDGMQSETVTIIKPNKRNIKLKYVTLPNATAEDPFNMTSATYTEYDFSGDVAQNAPAPYFFNYQGAKRNSFLSTKYVGSDVAGTASYLQNKFTRSEKALTIESCSLPNLADKYMMVRVYLDVTDWESKGLYRDITIRHLSTTRISHVVGAWSSRISARSALDSTDPNYEPFSTSTGPYGPEEYRYTSSTQYTYDRAVFNTWENNGTLTEEWEACTESEYNTGKAGSFPDDYKFEEIAGSPSNYTSKNQENYSNYFHNYGTEIDASNKKTAHTGEVNAYSQDGWYYWGESPDSGTNVDVQLTSVTTSDGSNESSYTFPSSFGGYDYYTFTAIQGARNGGTVFSPRYDYTGRFTFYRYTNRYRAQYTLRQYSRKKFGHTIGTYALNTDHVPSSSQTFRNYRWVNYDVDKTGTHTFRVASQGNNTTSNAPFRPKYISGGTAYYMTASNTSTGGQVAAGTALNFNPRMFIVQSSATSSSYVMGRPNIGSDGLSADRVLSPAFMIASQLGSTSNMPSINSTYDATKSGTTRVSSADELMRWEAKHCETYLEVGQNGVYYTGWRLPTVEEIGVIIGLQTSSPDGDTSLNQVLSAGYYRALNGNEVPTGSGLDTHTVRCVRDLTQAEIDALN
ncbi:MAG: hypothetical protein IKH11_06275 [Bacteroidales bacterium]|nr:hypothetical protein [Bacteroidales bacterium]